jgi:hypothetical protein
MVYIRGITILQLPRLFMSGSRGADDKKSGSDLTADEVASLRGAHVNKPVSTTTFTPPVTKAVTPPPLPTRPPKFTKAPVSKTPPEAIHQPAVNPAPVRTDWRVRGKAETQKSQIAELWAATQAVAVRLTEEVPARFAAIKGELTEQEISELGKYLEPFKNPAITNQPYIIPANLDALSYVQRVNELYSQVATQKRSDFIAALQQLAQQFYPSNTYLATVRERVDALMDKRIQENLQKKVPGVTERALAVKEDIKELAARLSEPHQYLPRFELWVKAITEEFLKKEKIQDSEAMIDKIKTTPEDDLSDQEKAFKQLDVIRGIFKAEAVRSNVVQLEREMYPFADAFKGIDSETMPPAFDRALKKKDPIARAHGIAKAYIDTYIDGRSLSLTNHTEKSSELNQVEKYLSKALNIKDETKIDKHILFKTDAFPDRNKLISHVFDRAVVEILVNNNQQAYANALKVIDRIGMRAVTIWNALANERLGADAAKMVIKADASQPHVTERQIKENFKALAQDDQFKSALSAKYFGPIIAHKLDALDFRTLEHDQYEKLSDLVEALNSAEETHSDPKVIFVEAYLDAYISERKKIEGHTDKGPLLTLIEKASVDFIRNSHSGTGKEDDAMIMSMAEKFSPLQKQIILEKLITRIQASIRNSDQHEFVNIIKAVKRMNLIYQWDNAAAESPQLTHLIIGGNKTLGKSVSENSIVKLYAQLSPSRSHSTLADSRGAFFRKVGGKLSISSNQSSNHASPNSPRSPKSGNNSPDVDSPKSPKSKK